MVLVTAFTPFGGESENMSMKVLSLLPDTVDKLVVPTSYEGGFAALRSYLDAHEPAAVILLGQASRPRLSVERVAINVADARLPDNDGVVLTDAPLEEGGPAACFSTLPIKKMAAAADACISDSAGTYVCNCLMYKALRRLDGRIPCGFVHVPKDGDEAYFAAEIVKMIAVL